MTALEKRHALIVIPTAGQYPKKEPFIRIPMFPSEEYTLPDDTKVDGKIVHNVRIIHTGCGDIYEYH